MNILRRELKCNIKGLLIWAIALALMNFWIITLFPSMAADGAKLEEMMELYPESMIRMFNMGTLSLSDPLGFYGVEVFFMVVLFGGIYAAILGSGILAKEEDEKTIEFLLAKPVSRGSVILEKTFAWIIYLVLFNLLLGIVSLIGFELFVKDYSLPTLFWFLIAPLFVHLTFAALGFMSALFFTRRKSALAVSIGLVLVFYFLHTVALLSDKLQFLGWLSPFKYMEAAAIYTDGFINPLHILVLLTITAAAVGITWHLYRRRDITI